MKALWQSPYAPAPDCAHPRIVEVTPPFQQPTPDWSKPVGGFVFRVREWACVECGTEVDPSGREKVSNHSPVPVYSPETEGR